MKWLVLAGAAVAGVIVSAAPARAGGAPEAGRKMSLEHCARYHVIGDFNPIRGHRQHVLFPAAGQTRRLAGTFPDLLRAPAASGLRARARRAALD